MLRRKDELEPLESRPRVRLLITTGAVGHDRSGSVFISDEQARKLEALPTRFETILVVKNWGLRKDLTCPLPPGIRAAWITTYRTKWHVLFPKRFFALKHEVEAADAFLTFVPTLDGLAPLVMAFVARRPRYILVIASPIHFRHSASGGRASWLLTRSLLNACALIATRVLVNGRALAGDLLPPLRRKATDIILSSLSKDDLIVPTRPDLTDVRLLCVCRLVPSKRVDIVIDAMQLLIDRGINAHLAIVGDGPVRNELSKQVHAIGLDDRVRFAGWIGERETLRRYYASADFFMSATEAEGISLAILEAMAAGLPVISTAPGGLRDFLVHGVDSMVVTDVTPRAFARVVQRLLEEPQTYMALAKKAQEKVSTLTNESWVDTFHRLVLKDLR